MIIKRKYACYYQLMNDPDSMEVILKSCKKYGMTEDAIMELLPQDDWVIVCNTDIGSGIPADIYNDFCAGFEILDREKPFDNGLTYNDVAGVVTYPSRKGNAMTQVLYSNYMEMPKTIVQVIAFECDESSIKQIEPWDIRPIIIR